MHNVDGPRVPMRDCCPGLDSITEMSEVRVEAIADFSGVEYVFCSDKEIRREHFPEEEWATVQNFCVPSDIVSQLEKADWMMGIDNDQHRIESEKLIKRLKIEKETILYRFNDKLSKWKRQPVLARPRYDKITRLMCYYFWLVFYDSFGEICYAAIVGAIRYGAAPRLP
jgi:hypothetical protein